MKKTLIALAVLATAGAAFAQSTVSITGNYGAGYLMTETIVAGVAAKSPTAAQTTALESAIAAFDTAQTAANAVALTAAQAAVNAATAPAVAAKTTKNKGIALTAATLKVGVTEDLGGGLKAAVNMQFDGYGSTSNQTFGQALLRRNTSISLTGGFGQVRFDNTRSSNLLTKGMVGSVNLDQGIYDTTNVITRSAVDVLTYGLAFGDFTGYAQYVEADTDGGTTPNVKVAVLGGGYAKGPIAAGIQYKMHDYNSTYMAKVGNNVANDNRLEAFATYDFGMAKVGVGYDGAITGMPAGAASQNDDAAWAVGVSAPLGPVTIGANFAKRGDNKVTELGANYNLSKRTALTAAYGRHTADAGNGFSGDQYLVAVTHAF